MAAKTFRIWSQLVRRRYFVQTVEMAHYDGEPVFEVRVGGLEVRDNREEKRSRSGKKVITLRVSFDDGDLAIEQAQKLADKIANSKDIHRPDRVIRSGMATVKRVAAANNVRTPPPTANAAAAAVV